MRSGEMHLSVLSMLAGNMNRLSYRVSAFCTEFLSSKRFIILIKTDTLVKEKCMVWHPVTCHARNILIGVLGYY